MRICLYGISRSGKNFLIESLVKRLNHLSEKTLFHVNGSGILGAISERLFSQPLKDTNEEQKRYLRSVFCDEIAGLNNGFRHIIVDGHYSFPIDNGNGFNIVFTNKDRDLYDTFFYLDTPANKIIQYANKDSVKKSVAFMTEKEIDAWKKFEIEELRKVCIARDKELIVLDNNIDDSLDYFERYLFNNTSIILDTEETVRSMIAEHQELIDRHDKILLLDCDRTLSNNDTTYDFCELLGIEKSTLKNIFTGEHYSSYQFFRAAKLYAQKDCALYNTAGINAAEKAILNHPLIEDIKKNGKEYLSIGITSGIIKTWKTIQLKIYFPEVIMGGSNLNTDSIVVSRAVKHQLVKFLHREGKYVIAVGDSTVDIDMLEEADCGFIVAQEKINSGIASYFKTTATKIVQLAYSPYHYDDIYIKGGIFL